MYVNQNEPIVQPKIESTEIHILNTSNSEFKSDYR